MPKNPCKYCDSTEHRPFQCFFKPKEVAKPCKFCGSKLHLAWQCYQNPKRAEQIKSKTRAGKVTKNWLAVRKQYLDRFTEYECTYCGRYLTRNQVEVDHYKPRGSHPELRFDESNLRISCHNCNTSKGSIDGDVFIKRYKEG